LLCLLFAGEYKFALDFSGKMCYNIDIKLKTRKFQNRRKNNMIKLSQNYIENFTGNSGTVSNGKSLAGKKFSKLYISPDETLIFGECSGSGKNPYYCSVDFLDEENPIPRCNCPSRQIPCKHAVGLLFAYLDGKEFTTEEIPADVAAKREKILKRAEKKEAELSEPDKKEEPKPPSKAKINSAIKKINIQLDGISLAEKLLHSIALGGLAGIDANKKESLSVQIKELGNYYITGVQTAFNELILCLNDKDEEFRKASEQLLYIFSLLAKGREFLEEKKSSNPLALSFGSSDGAIAEQIGHIWKLDELRQIGNIETDTELVQISFIIYEDFARKEFIDAGYFVSLKSGRVFRKINYRPYKALRHIKQDDTFFDVMCTKEMYYYPGFSNPRFRADGFTVRNVSAEDYAKIISFASEDFAAVQKAVKNEIKNPLAEKNPIFLLKPRTILPTHSVSNHGEMIIEDKNGVGQILSDCTFKNIPVMNELLHINPAILEDAAILVMFDEDINTGILAAKPMSIILPNRIIRLLF
jgi:hypothetical protein